MITLSGSDVDSASLTFSVTGGPSHGTLSAIAPVSCIPTGVGGTACTGTVTYTPASHYYGPDSFTYKVNDGSSDSNTATVTLTVTAVDYTITASAGANGTISPSGTVSVN